MTTDVCEHRLFSLVSVVTESLNAVLEGTNFINLRNPLKKIPNHHCLLINSTINAYFFCFFSCKWSLCCSITVPACPLLHASQPPTFISFINKEFQKFSQFTLNTVNSHKYGLLPCCPRGKSPDSLE